MGERAMPSSSSDSLRAQRSLDNKPQVVEPGMSTYREGDPRNHMKSILLDMGVSDATDDTMDMLLEFQHRVTVQLIEEAHVNAEYSGRNPRHHITQDDVAIAKSSLPKPKHGISKQTLQEFADRINAKPLTLNHKYLDTSIPIAERLIGAPSCLIKNKMKRKAGED